MAVRRRSGPKMRSSRQGDRAGSRGKRTNGNSYSKHKHEPRQPALCLPESRNDYGCTRRKWSAISFRRWRPTSEERPFAFSAGMRIPVRKRQIFISATIPWVIVQASADQNAITAHVQFGCEARPLRVALARPAKINNGQNKKSSRKGVET
jgi:hypothetical protein